LNPQAQDVAAIEPRASASRSGDESARRRTIARQVARWRRRVRRARAAVVLRRYLMISLGLAVIGEVVARLVEPETHPLWAFAGVALAFVGALAALATPIKDATVAAMLDHGLGLFDTIGTALELESKTIRNERTNASPTLTAHVVAEAQEALHSSFGAARARSRPAGREWAAVPALALVLALLVALPSSGHTQFSRSGLTRHTAGAGGGEVDHRGSQARRARGRQRAPQPVGALAGHRSLVAPLTAASSQAIQNLVKNLYRHGANPLGRQQMSRTGLSKTTGGTHLAGLPGPSGGQSASGTPTSGAQGASGAGATSSASARAGERAAPGGPVHGAPGGARSGVQAAGTPAQRSARSRSNEGGQFGKAPSGATPPGGENAGADRGSTALQAGLAPNLVTGNSDLRLKAGYAPSAARNPGHGGIAQTPNGGGGSARSVAGRGATGGGSGPSSQGAIQPTPNTDAPGTKSLVNNYFGGANQLRPGSW
jgi:hypothetical protein